MYFPALLLLTFAALVNAFLVTPRSHVCAVSFRNGLSSFQIGSSSSSTDNRPITTNRGGETSTIFDFSKNETIAKFDRIDDVIMGGISTSSIRKADDEDYATWRGVCRETGGGFCGTRTLPFLEPLDVGNADGFYVEARLASDDEPERRVWKLSTRTEASRGEELYQAEFDIGTEWKRVRLPFSEFKLVRGPRSVPASPKMNATNGIFQVGLTMSKFVLAENITSLPNFRPGYFEVQLKEIGVYSPSKDVAPVMNTPNTRSKEESKRKRSLLLKLLLPVASLFFSERAQRRKCTMKILRERRGSSRLSAILWGIRVRSSSKIGVAKSSAQALGFVAIDSFRAVFFLMIRYGVFYPLVFLSRGIKLLKKAAQKKAMQDNPTTPIV